MGSFDFTAVSHTGTESRPEPARPVWLRPAGVLPAIAGIDLVLAHTNVVAIALSGFWCYPNGFEFGIHVVLREPDLRGQLMSRQHHTTEAGEPIPPEMLRIGLQFGGDTKLTNLPEQFGHYGRDEPDRPVMISFGSAGDERSHRYQYWVWPLPPAGPLTFVCEWPHFHIDETQATIDAQVVLDAASRAVTLWPEP